MHKHGAGAAVNVTVRGVPGAGLHVRVSNPLPSGRLVPRQGGLGLVGLAERVELSGGSMSHGPTETGEFALDALLRWPA